MQKYLLILLSFSILNQSIDMDHLRTAFRGSSRTASFDDADTIAEYVIEQLVDDDDYFPETDDDSDEAPQNSGMEKFSWNPLCCSFFSKIVIPTHTSDLSLLSVFQVHPPCKGYLNIVSPPPDDRS